MIGPTSGTQRQQGDRWIVLADQALTNNDFVTALDCCVLATQVDPTNASHWITRAGMHLHSDHYKEALMCGDTLIKLHPRNNKGYKVQGNAYYKLKQYHLAVELFEQALKWTADEKKLKLQKLILNAKMQTDTLLDYYRFSKEYINNKLTFELMVIKFWPLNRWWYLPTSLTNPSPCIRLQKVDWNIAGSESDWHKTENTALSAKQYASFGFSDNIHFLRGPSAIFHPCFFEPEQRDSKHKKKKGSEDDLPMYFELATMMGSCPEVILWATDIPYHLALAMGSEREGLPSHYEQTMLIDKDIVRDSKEDLKARKILLERAWVEALRVPELHPLVFILFPALKQRYMKSKSKPKLERAVTFLTQFISICIKLKTVNFESFSKIVHMLGEIQESLGLRKEAVKSYELALNSKFTFKYTDDKRTYDQKREFISNNLAILYKQDKQYDEAWVSYQKATEFDVSRTTWHNIMKLFLCEDWNTKSWRQSTALAYVKKNWTKIKANSQEVILETNFWPEIIRKVAGGAVMQLTDEANKQLKKKSGATQVVGDIINKNNTSTPVVCDGCLKMFPKVKTCAGCNLSKFCSTECQKANWPKHKSFCKSIQEKKKAKSVE